jgi:polysaccharide pyruvyl transferase WcaK-like protein
MADRAAGARAEPPRVGLFGWLTAGNSGNEASMEAILAYLSNDHPDAVIDAMTGGFRRLRDNYRINSIPLTWSESHDEQENPLARNIFKVFGKLIDPFRIVLWVRRHDVVIVPGTGVLEATLPMRAYTFPLSMCLLGMSGKLFGVKVALVSVGASNIKKRATRWLSNGAARTAFYRSYRDVHSMDAIRQRGIDTSSDRVFPDLVFGAPIPAYASGGERLVGVGVMDYHGGNDDRARASAIHAAYVEKISAFIDWLLENGYSVRLFGGDGKVDYAVADQLQADVYARQPDLARTRVMVETFSSYAELLGKLNQVETVVATRYHNVMSALKLCKPTISLGYSQKFVSLMEGMGVAEFCQPADSFSVDRLIQQFNELQNRRAELRQTLRRRNEANDEGLTEQFALMSTVLFWSAERGRLAAAGVPSVTTGSGTAPFERG